MLNYLYFILILKISVATCQRRITNGTIVGSDTNTNFVAYLVGAKPNETYPGWICGGSIIHPSLILTSAACLYDVQHLYAIVGYREYVSTEQLNNNACTKHMKKKVVSFCVHFEFGHLQEHKVETHTEMEKMYRWAKFDIGVARVESPIDFFDSNYLKYCSYLPGSIYTNYNSRYEHPGTNVVVYGWGHTTYYRPKDNKFDYNERFLRYTSSVTMHKLECVKYFENEYVRDRIGVNYICADGKGNLDAHGRYLTHKLPELVMCNSRKSGNSTVNVNHTKCFEDNTSTAGNSTDTPNNITNTRRHGICQNDHGSPLVHWIGGRPYVIGVATAFQVNKKMECVGPYLYTSVLCSSRFIHCVIREQNTTKYWRRTRSNCDAPDYERGFKIVETKVEWNDDGLDDLDLSEEELDWGDPTRK